MKLQGAILGMLLLVVAEHAHAVSDNDTYTLYRNSPAFPNMRIHVATFDAADGDSYNNENCRTASELFGKQAGVVVRYWCEKGRYQK